MTDLEFLDRLQTRAAELTPVIVSDTEMTRLNTIAGRLAQFDFRNRVPAGRYLWAVSAVDLCTAIGETRALLLERIKTKLLS